MELKQLIKQQKARGVLVKTLAHPSLAIMTQDCGMGFILHDCEHGILSCEQLHDLMVFGGTRKLSSIIRVAQLTRSDIPRILDYGTAGVMVPMIETAKQVEQLVQWSKHPPLGERSYSGGANMHYAPGGNHVLHMKQLDEKMMNIVQVEAEQGMENIEAVLNVKRIDGALIDPYDLAIPLGRPDDLVYEEELNMVQKATDACLKRVLGFGIVGSRAMQEYFKEESSLLVSAIDIALMREGLKRTVREYEQLGRT